MNETEAKTIIILSQADNDKKDVFYLSARLNVCYSAMYNYLRLLEAKGYVKKFKIDRKTIYEVTGDNTVEIAKKRLINGENSAVDLDR